MQHQSAEACTEAIRARLQELLAQFTVPNLRGAVGHLLGRGKLFRPRLACATALAVSGEYPKHRQLDLVLPLELIHTFTLIHDDLPCMDDSDLRRGVPAVHRQFDEALAVLAGDALCNLAFAVLGDPEVEASDNQRIALVRALALAVHLVVEGQVLDIEAEHRAVDLVELLELHRRKTGALLGAACEFGGILAGATAEQLAALGEIGRDIGLVFQIKDDLLSAGSSTEQIGKPVELDTIHGKSTFPLLLGEEGAQRYAAETLEAVLAAIDALKLAAPDELRLMARSSLDRSW